MRSLLFVPGDAERKLRKALDCSADAVVIDLEDAVAQDAKASARDLTQAFLREALRAPQRPRLCVRINDLTTPYWEEDIARTMPAAPDAIMLPKPRSGEDVHRLSIALEHAESTGGLAIGATAILAIVTETPASVLALGSYVGASARLAGLSWGAEDLSAAVGAAATRDAGGALTSPFRLVRDLCLLTAAAAGVAAIDTVYRDFKDLDGLTREAREAARDGFSGKLAIHPDQVPVINAAFTPTAEEVAEARAIVEAFAASSGAGVVALSGRMLDRPHLARAKRVLERARLAAPS